MQPEDIFKQLQQHNENLANKVRLEQLASEVTALRKELAAMQESYHLVNERANIVGMNLSRLFGAGKRLRDFIEMLGKTGKLPQGTVSEAVLVTKEWDKAI